MSIPSLSPRSARRVVSTLRQKSTIRLAVGGAIYAAGVAHALTALIRSFG